MNRDFGEDLRMTDRTVRNLEWKVEELEGELKKLRDEFEAFVLAQKMRHIENG